MKSYCFIVVLAVAIGCKVAGHPTLSQTADSEQVVPQRAAGGTWTPDLATLEGRIATIQAIASQHPMMALENMRYRRNLVDPLVEAAEILRQLEKNRPNTTLGQSANFWAYRFDGAALKPNERGLATFRAEMHRHLNKIAEILPSFSSLVDDLAKLPADVKVWTSFLAVAPWIYGSDGEVLPDGASRADAYNAIESADPSDIAERYQHSLPEHLLPLLQQMTADKTRTTIVEAARNRLANQFTQKVVQNAISYADDAGRLKVPKVLSLEELPPLVAIYRSFLGHDCSLKNLPFYPLDPNTKVYAIRKTSFATSDAAGYALVTPVTIEGDTSGKTYPMIMTVNGRLTADGVRQVVRMVGNIWDSKDVLVSTNGVHSNTPAMREGLRADGEEKKIRFSDSWNEIAHMMKDKYLNDYYRRPTGAKLVRTEGITLEFSQLPPRYLAKSSLFGASKLARAIFASDVVTKNDDPALRDEVLKNLELNERAWETAVRLSKVLQHHKQITRQLYGLMRTDLDFDVSQLKDLSPEFAVDWFIGMFNSLKDDAPEIDWASMAKALHRRYLKEVAEPNVKANPEIGKYFGKLLGLARIEPSLRQATVDQARKMVPAKTLFEAAAAAGDVALVRQLRAEGINNEFQAVAAATRADDLEFFKETAGDLKDRSFLLEQAANSSAKKIFKYLLEDGHPLTDSIIGLIGQTGLEINKILVSHLGADYLGEPPLAFGPAVEGAAQSGDIETVKYLLETAQGTATKSSIWHAYIIARDSRNSEISDYLVREGAKSVEALQAAARNNDLRFLTAAEMHGADIAKIDLKIVGKFASPEIVQWVQARQMARTNKGASPCAELAKEFPRP